MCIRSINVPSSTRYISLKYHDRFFNSFGCGQCCECMQLKSLQWSFRCNYEYDDLPDDAFVMFDCLSYRPKDLPHLSDFWSFLDSKNDFPCFNRKHIRNFLQTLRQRVIRAGYRPEQCRYYYACEYGTRTGRTHRPHIHLMFFCYGIDKLWLSQTIADVWKYGRTDGIPYKSHRYVLMHNVVDRNNLTSRLRTINYITKYLQKSCLFQSEINKRVAIVMRRLAEFATDDSVLQTADQWLESEVARRERLKLLRFVNQFHHTSQQFGATAIQCFDWNQLVETGASLMPHSGNVKIRVPLSNYYKRKMFYDKVEVNGSFYYQINDIGIEYANARKNIVFNDTVSRFTAELLTANIKADPIELSDYVLNKRGYILSSSDQPSFSVQERFDNADFYNYSTCSDKLQFNCRGLSLNWLGDPQQGYISDEMFNRIPLKEFIGKYVFFDQEKEGILDKLNMSLSKVRNGKQEMYKLRQRMRNLCKMLS